MYNFCMTRYRRKDNYKKHNKYRKNFYRSGNRSKEINPWALLILIAFITLWKIRYFLLSIITIALPLYVFYKGWKYFANKKFTPEMIGFLGEEKFSQQILKKNHYK